MSGMMPTLRLTFEVTCKAPSDEFIRKTIEEVYNVPKATEALKNIQPFCTNQSTEFIKEAFFHAVKILLITKDNGIDGNKGDNTLMCTFSTWAIEVTLKVSDS